MGFLVASFAMIFASMLVLVAIQYLRNDILPTGCTPGGCQRCRKDCPKKAALRAQTDEEGS